LLKRFELFLRLRFCLKIKNHLIFYFSAKKPFFFYFLFSDFIISSSGQIKDGSSQSYWFRFTSLSSQDLNQSWRQIGRDITIIFGNVLKLIVLAHFFPEIKIKKEPDKRPKDLPASPGQTQAMKGLFLLSSGCSGLSGLLDSFFNQLFFLVLYDFASKATSRNSRNQPSWPDNPDFKKLVCRNRCGLKLNSLRIQYV